MTHPHESSMLAILDMKESLDQAVNDAGGAGIHLDDLAKMSALDLMLHLAPNDIRFAKHPPAARQSFPKALAKKKALPKVVYRLGNFKASEDDDDQPLFMEDVNGCWAEIDIGDHTACMYVCLKLMDDHSDTEHGQWVLDLLKAEPEVINHLSRAEVLGRQK